MREARDILQYFNLFLVVVVFIVDRQYSVFGGRPGTVAMWRESISVVLSAAPIWEEVRPSGGPVGGGFGLCGSGGSGGDCGECGGAASRTAGAWRLRFLGL